METCPVFGSLWNGEICLWWYMHIYSILQYTCDWCPFSKAQLLKTEAIEAARDMCFYSYSHLRERFFLNSGEVFVFYKPCYHISLQLLSNLFAYLLILIFLTKMDLLHHCQCQLYLSKSLTCVCSTGAWWVICKYISRIQHGLSFRFLSQPFGGDNVSEGRTCSSKKVCAGDGGLSSLGLYLEVGGRGEEKKCILWHGYCRCYHNLLPQATLCLVFYLRHICQV